MEDRNSSRTAIADVADNLNGSNCAADLIALDESRWTWYRNFSRLSRFGLGHEVRCCRVHSTDEARKAEITRTPRHYS